MEEGNSGSLNEIPSKTVKNVFYFIQKTFRSRDIQIFVFMSSAFLFLPVSHFFRG